MQDISISSTRSGPRRRPKGRPGNHRSSTKNRPDWGGYGLCYCIFPYENQIIVPLHEDGLVYKRKHGCNLRHRNERTHQPLPDLADML